MFHRFRDNFLRKREILCLIYLKLKILGEKFRKIVMSSFYKNKLSLMVQFIYVII